jgi:hypothetical protein
MAANTNPSPLATVNFGDPSKVNLFGAREQDTQEYQKALQDSLIALEKRYEQPNWFKIAAGFAKPQLGGFMASLGSANEAMAENIENQRAQQLPISQLRAQLALSKITMGQNQDAAQEFSNWRATGLPMDEQTYAKITGLAPSSAVAAAAKAAYDAEKTNQTLRVSQNDLLVKQQQQDMLLLDSQRKSGLITEDQYKAGLKAIAARQVERPPVFPTGTTGNASERMGAQPPVGVGNALDILLDPLAKPAEEVSPTTPPSTKFKFKSSFSLPYKQAVTEDEKAANASVLAMAVDTNAEPSRQFKALQKINDPTNYAIAMEANSSVQDAIRTNPEAFVKVTNLIRQAGGMAAMLEKGLSMNWNGYGVNVGIPITAGIDASLSPEEQAYRDTLMNNLATSAYYSLLARGEDPNKAGEGKLSIMLAQEMHIDKAPKAIAHQIDLNKEQLKYANRLHDVIASSLPQAVASGSLAPHFDIERQDPQVKIERAVYDAILKSKSKKFQEMLKGKKP